MRPLTIVIAMSLIGLQPPKYDHDPYVDRIVAFNPGPGAGFGKKDFPQFELMTGSVGSGGQ